MSLMCKGSFPIIKDKNPFSTANYMKIHINTIHNDEKDHKCDSCGKSFSQSGSLKTRINSVHNGQ